MSGPKTSRYTLTSEQRHILLEQRERQRKIIEERNKLKRLTMELQTICAEFDDSLEKAKTLSSRTGEGVEYIQSVSKLKEQAAQVLRQNSDVSRENGLEALEARRKMMESCLGQVQIAEKSLKKQAAEIEAKLKTDIDRSLDKGFGVSFEDIRVKGRNDQFETLRQQIADKLTTLTAVDFLPQEYINEAEDVKRKLSDVKTIDFLENFSALTVASFEKKCSQYLTEYNEYSEPFYDLLARYEALCEMLEVQKQDFIFSVQTISTLKAEISGMEKELVEAEEQAYISRSIDEVMSEMGYEVLGHREVIKRSGKRFRNELYAFSEGTAVNVTYASDGKITIELGGVDIADRMPTEDETKRLCDDMENFCKDFTEIEKRLSQRGVVVGSRVSILSPTEEYAQIINAVDYELKHEIATIKAKKHKSRGTMAKKVMRNE